MTSLLISKILKKHILLDQQGRNFMLMSDKIIEERTNDFVCITFYNNDVIVGRFYDYNSLIQIDDKNNDNQTVN